MNKYILLSIVLSITLASCSKNVSINDVNIDTSSWIKISTENWTIETTENWAKISTDEWLLKIDPNWATITSWENFTSIWDEWFSVSDWESTMNITSTWLQLNWSKLNIDENTITSDIDWIWDISITSNWTK